MTTWSRNGNTDVELNFHVKLGANQWTTVNPDGVERPAHDLGGDVTLINEIARSIKENENFHAFKVARRATRTFFLPQIVVREEVLPEELCTEKTIQALSLGPQYDIFVSFGSKEEVTLFKLSFRDGVNVGFGGIN